MPAKQRTPLVSLRGGEEYAAFLDELAVTIQRSCGGRLLSRHGLAELALAELGIEFGVRAPRRARPAHRPRKPPA